MAAAKKYPNDVAVSFEIFSIPTFVASAADAQRMPLAIVPPSNRITNFLSTAANLLKIFHTRETSKPRSSKCHPQCDRQDRSLKFANEVMYFLLLFDPSS